MLTIRLHRIGKRNEPSFKMVIVDKRKSAAAGRFCEEVGSVNRVAKKINLNKERLSYWLSKGAQPSPTVHNLLVSEKMITAKKIAKHGQPKKKEDKAAEVAIAAKPAGEKK